MSLLSPLALPPHAEFRLHDNFLFGNMSAGVACMAAPVHHPFTSLKIRTAFHDESPPFREHRDTIMTGSDEADSARSAGEDWQSVTDPAERRKIQNKLAQRKFREKAKQAKEENERQAENRRRAHLAYSTPEPEDIDTKGSPSGLPWGSVSLKHVIASGRAKELLQMQQQQQHAREAASHMHAAQMGGSSRLGLQLVNEFSKGDYPRSWALFGPTSLWPPRPPND